jgi:hypothetical protein
MNLHKKCWAANGMKIIITMVALLALLACSQNDGKKLRLRALTKSPAKVGFAPDKQYPKVYGVVVDLHMIAKGTFSIVAMRDGTATVYTTFTPTVTKGLASEGVRKAAEQCVETANQYYDRCLPVSHYPYPEPRTINFYLLTYDGVRLCVGDEGGGPRGTDPMYDLYFATLNLFSALTDTAEQKTAEKTPIAAAQEGQFLNASSDKDSMPTKFWFELKDKKVIIDNEGNAEAKYSNGKVKRTKIPLPKYFQIEKMQFSGYLGDIIIVCELTDGDTCCGRAFRLDRDRFNVKWYAKIDGLNVGEPLQQDNRLYLTALGWVGKLDVLTGKYDWQIGDLYTRPSRWYDSFKKPFIKDEKVHFPGWGSSPTLIVDDKTGKILEGAPPKNEE